MHNEVLQYGGHTPANGLTETCSLDLQRTSLIFEIHVKINYQNMTSAGQYHMTITQAQF